MTGADEMVSGRIRTRSVEMLLAVVMATQGAIFLIPGRTLALEHYAYLREWVAIFPGDESSFGAILLLLGLCRFGAILANGHWKPGDWYPSPVVRLIGCCIGSLFWTSLTISFLSADIPGTPAALGWTIPSFIFEIFSAVRAAVDAHIYDSFGIRRRQRARNARS